MTSRAVFRPIQLSRAEASVQVTGERVLRVITGMDRSQPIGRAGHVHHLEPPPLGEPLRYREAGNAEDGKVFGHGSADAVRVGGLLDRRPEARQAAFCS